MQQVRRVNGYLIYLQMVGAITTYLIIYIQFSNVYLIKDSDNLSIRSMNQDRPYE